MKCYNCGSEIPDESRFCSNCGVSLAPRGGEAVIVDGDNAADEFEGPAEAAKPQNTELPDTEEADNAERTEASENTESSDNVIYEEAYNRQVSDKKKKPPYILWIAIAAAAIVLLCIRFGMSYFTDSNIVGQWRTESNDSIFGMFDETYIIFEDDGTADYYSGIFTHEKWKYRYNPIFGTLKISQYGSMKGADTLHIKWLSADSFVIVENGTTFVRSGSGDSGYSDDDYDSSYETGENEFF